MARRAKTQFAILGALTLGPQSGYEIAKFCREVLASFWGESYGQIYPKLKELAAAKLVRIHGESKSDRRKILYELTTAGKKELHRWLKEPAESQAIRNEHLLKLVFAADVSADVSRQHLIHFREINQGLLKSLEYSRAGLKSTDELTKKQKRQFEMTIRLGELVAKARIAWVRECLKLLENEP